jgi:hypothetical protein
MLGADVPDLTRTPCPVCDQFVEGEVVWDPWYPNDIRLAAMPLHPACAASFLPPSEPTPEMRRCGICDLVLETAGFDAAFAALHERFKAPTGTAGAGKIVWRLANRDPRVFAAEHFDCILKRVNG